MQGAWILSLASKLKFHRLCSVAKTKKVDIKITLIIGKCPVVEVLEKPLKLSYGHGLPSCKLRYLLLIPFTVYEC